MVVHSRLRANSKSVESLDQTNEMERGLSNRHVQFIAIGGTIGTGLFLGSGKSISLTGPSIIFVVHSGRCHHVLPDARHRRNDVP